MIPAEIQRSISNEGGKGFFELSLATTSTEGNPKLAYSQLEFSRKDLQPPRAENEMAYDILVLKRIRLSVDAGTKLLEQLYDGQQLGLTDLTGFSPFNKQNPPVQFVSSQAPFTGFSREWPVHYGEFIAPNAAKAGPLGSVLAKPGLPLYPTTNEAIRGFFGLGRGRRWTFNDYGKLLVVVPDFRARIDEFKIGYHRISLKVVAGAAQPDSLRCKMYVENEMNSASSDDIKLKDNVAFIEPSFEPSRVLAVLMDSNDGSVVDSRDWYPGYVYPDYAKVERPEQQVRDLIAAGEGKRIEFKSALEDRDDFLETVVAFANSEGGLILLGINNHRVAVGFKGDGDAITKMIRDSCEPTIEPAFTEYELDGFPVFAVEIPIGQDKPYILKRKGVVYVRVGPNDVPASRLDLDQLTKQSNPSGPWGLTG
jgi:hypothetical protein